MRKHGKFKCLALMLLNAWLLPGAMLHAAMTPPGIAQAVSMPPLAGPEQASLLQYQSGEQLLGFSPEKMVAVASGGTALTEEFVGASGVMPSAAATGGEAATAGEVKRGGKAQPFTGVTYQGLWSGVNLSYRPTGDGFAESVYEIASGTDISRIKLRYNVPVEVQKDGHLKFTPPANNGYFLQSPPVAWQMIDGINKPVAVAFKQYGDGTIGFNAGAYDRSYPLIIDPSYSWHTFYGGSGSDRGQSIAIDSSGNAYITGFSTAAWNGPVGQAPLHAFAGGTDDLFVLKLDSTGAYQWHTFYGGTNSDEGLAVAVDANGNVYATGYSTATWNGPTGQSPLQANNASSAIFVLKLSSAGAYQWHTFYGGEGQDHANGVATDGSGNVYATGYSTAIWNGPTGQVPKNPFSGFATNNIVVLKLDSSGTYLWHTFYSSGGSEANGVAVDSSGNAYITGFSTASWGSPLHAHSGGYDIFVLKLSSAGAYAWNTFYGSSGDDYGHGVAVDSSGNVYVTGYSSAAWGSPLKGHNGNNDIFVLTLNSAGAYQWHTFYGSSAGDVGNGIAVDANSNVYVTGYSLGIAAWPWTGHPPLNSVCVDYNIFVLKLNGAGTYQWHTFYGYADNNYGNGIAVDSTGHLVYVTGASNYSWSDDYNHQALHSYSSDDDIFVLKLADRQTLTVAKTGAGTGTITSIPAGINFGATASCTFDYNTAVTLTPTSTAGSVFAGWSGDGTDGVVTMSADKSCTATFRPPTVMAAPGKTLTFNGTSQYVTIPDANSLDLTTNYTLETWFKADSFGSGGGAANLRGLIGKCQTASANGYLLRTNLTELDFDQLVTSGLNLQTGQWYHVAAVNSNGTRHLYVNGVEKTITGTGYTVLANTDPIRLGSDYNGRYFAGQLDEVRIWNVARSQAEIQNSMHHVLTGSESGLAAYYQFDESSGTVLPDLTANSNLGTLVNSPTWTTATTPLANVIASKTNIRGAWIANTNTLASSRMSVASASVTGTNFAVFGHDNGTDAWQITDVPGTVNSRLSRVWRAEVSGSSTGTIKIDTTGLSDIGDGSTLRLLVDADGTFASGATTVAGTYSAPYFTVASQAIANGSYYTLGANRSSYTVTYNGNTSSSGTAPTDGSSPYYVGSTVTVLANTGSLTKTGALFDGWNTAANGSGTAYAATGSASFTMPAANVTLYAHWIPIYSVTYAANGANSGTAPDAQTKTQGIGLTLASNTGSLTKTNYTFGGWNTAADGSGTSYAAGATYSTDAALALYAKWTALPSNSTAVTAYGQSGGFTTGSSNMGGITANSLNGPAGLVVDGSGNVYVADSVNNRVLYYQAGSTTATRVYGQNGDFTTSSANNGGVSASSLSSPQACALDSSGNLYVADTDNNRVLYYPAGTTTATRVYGQDNFTSNAANKGGPISASSLNGPTGLVLDASNSLYVADCYNNRVLYYPAGTTTATRVYGQGGIFTTGDANQGGISANSLKFPFGIALNASGGLVVADISNNRVLGYPAGTTTATAVYGQGSDFTTNTNNKGGTSADSLSMPLAVVVDGSGGLLVADMNNNRVLCYPVGSTTATRVYGQGCVFTTGTANKGGLSANSLKAPAGLALDGSGNLYVSDQQNHRVLKYDPTLPQAYTVTYDGNGSDGGTTPVDGGSPYLSGTTVTVLANTYTKSGYNFAGWYPVADGSGTVYGASFIMGSANTTLYAKWTALSTYAVTYNANNPTTGTAPDAQTKTQGIDLTLATNSGSLAKDGYTFAGWNTVADGSGATYSAGATYTTDATLALYAYWTAVPLGMTPPGNALVFNGTDQSVSLPASLAKDVGDTEAITIEYWFKGSQLQSPVRFQDDNGYIVAGWGASGPQHIISTDGGTANGLTVGDEGIVENGEWHHLAMTWERNTPNGFKSYLDGILVAQRDSADNALPPLSDATPYLGALHGSSEFLAGHMDEVRIWNVVRTVTEINNNMRVELTGSESGLVAYYSFNEITGTSLPDVTGKGHTGTLTNMSDANWVASTVPFDTSKAYVTATATGNGSGTVSSSTGGLSYSYPATNSGATSAIAKAEGVILTATAGTISTASWTTCTGGTIVGNGTATATCTFSTLDGNKTATVTFTRPPATLYVDKGATGSNNGSSWANAYTDLQSALTASGSTDTILVAQGVYKPTSGTDRTVSFQLKTGVSIYGGYPTGGTGSRTPKTYVTTLSGDIGTEGDSSDNSYAVVNGSGTDNTAILDGFTISGGNANHFDNRTPGDYGAGMYNNAGSPKVQNVTFSNNRAIYDGGGMYNERGSNPVITDVTFADNSANYGGGMYNDSSNPTLTNVTFSNNFTIDAGDGDGKGDGGGIYNYGSSPSLTNVTFNGNSANYGGGICNGYSSNSGAIPTLMNVTFSNNSATYWGGGMSNSEGSPTLTNCILWGNSPDQIYDFDSTPIVTYSVVQGGYSGTGNLSSDPLLGTLGSYGGYTQTMPLLTGSPAIDAGTDTGAPATDQRGVARPKGARYDIGAFELDTTAVAPTVDGIVAASAYPVAAINVTITGTNFTGTPIVTLQKSGYTTIQATNVILNSTTELTCTLDISGAAIGARDVVLINPDGRSGVKSNGFTVLDTPRGNVYVDKNISGGTHDGSSWVNAFTDLAGILPSAQSGDTIHVAQGTYKPTAGADRTKTFLLKDGVTLRGGYQTGGALRDAKTYPVILSGDLLGNDNSVVTKDEATRSENSYHVVTRSGSAGNSATLDGFTVSGGNANGENNIGYGNIGYGGGLYNEGDGNLTLKDVAVSNNSANYGGGLFNRSNGTLRLTNITLSNNTAYYDGGGLYASYSANTFTNMTFSGNTASGGNGGGMYFDNCASSALMNVTFSGNTASGGNGAGIYIYGDNSLTITNSILWGNSPDAIYDQGAEPIVTYSVVQGGYNGDGNLSNDPLLGSLGNYGGSTQTIPLQAGSPAIDAGTATGAPASDQRGTARPQASGYDIGAYEYVVATTYAVTYDANGGTGTAPGTQTKTQGINLILASNSGSLTKTGFTFAGWNTAADGSGTSYATGATYSTDAALVLFAKWTANDSDSDGLPDWWELKYSGSTTAMSASGNTDGTGMSNLTKYAFGLDPTKGSSVNPIIDTTALHGAGQFSYTRAANSILTYTVWTSTDLSDWGVSPAAATQEPRVPAVNDVETVDVTLTGYTPPPGGKLFVRVKAAR